MRPDIVAKWVANAPLEMLEQYASNLRKYYAVAIEVGTSDTLLASNRQLHEALTRLRVPHSYEEYDGDHTNRVKRTDRAECAAVFLEGPGGPGEPDVAGASALNRQVCTLLVKCSSPSDHHRLMQRRRP